MRTCRTSTTSPWRIDDKTAVFRTSATAVYGSKVDGSNERIVLDSGMPELSS